MRLQIPYALTCAARLALLAMGALLAACAPPGGGAITVWVVSGDRDIAPNSALLAENDIFSAADQTVRLVAAANETLGIQVAVRPAAVPAGPFEVRISDLVGEGVAISAATATRRYRAHARRVDQFASWYPDASGRPATPVEVLDVLAPWDAPIGGGPLRLNDASAGVVWIDVAIPADAAPGLYTGRLEVVSTQTAAIRSAFLVQLRVAAARLPDECALPIICRVDPRALLREAVGFPVGSAAETRILPGEASHAAAARFANATMRLLRQHRMTPAFTASFPKYRPSGPRSVEIDWEAYDALVGPWFDGTAFDNAAPLEVCLAPATLEHPAAERSGGIGSATYAGLLSAYLVECKRHFAERGWLERAALRPLEPSDLTQSAVERVRRFGAILRQSETRFPLIAHLPPTSLRSLGWINAPSADLSDVGVYAAPAGWLEPLAIERLSSAGRRVWFIPDHPPYSGALALAAPSVDPRVMAWQAFRYGLSGIWVERATNVEDLTQADAQTLVYSGLPYGVRDQPIPSVRLKQARRGQQDYELLRLLQRDQPLLARRTAEQVVRWAFTDACEDHLLSFREVGWPRDAAVFSLARRLVLQELSNSAAPGAAGREEQIRNLTDWARLMTSSSTPDLQARGVRLVEREEGLRALVTLSVSNPAQQPLEGALDVPILPAGWGIAGKPRVTVPANARRAAQLELALDGLVYNQAGVTEFAIDLDAGAAGLMSAAARLAVVGCPLVERAPRIDGELGDWSAGVSNGMGDFRLARGASSDPRGGFAPAAPTTALVAMDAEHIYLAITCGLQNGRAPLWQGNNETPVDGGIPWGQDVVEVLLDPANQPHGSGADLFVLQIKPSGLLVARKGALTSPPMNPSEPWQSGAEVAARIRGDAWVVELALPIRALGPEAAKNRIWGLNIARLDARLGEYSSWSGARSMLYAPHLLGNLVLLRE